MSLSASSIRFIEVEGTGLNIGGTKSDCYST